MKANYNEQLSSHKQAEWHRKRRSEIESELSLEEIKRCTDKPRLEYNKLHWRQFCKSSLAEFNPEMRRFGLACLNAVIKRLNELEIGNKGK